ESAPAVIHDDRMRHRAFPDEEGRVLHARIRGYHRGAPPRVVHELQGRTVLGGDLDGNAEVGEHAGWIPVDPVVLLALFSVAVEPARGEHDALAGTDGDLSAAGGGFHSHDPVAV